MVTLLNEEMDSPGLGLLEEELLDSLVVALLEEGSRDVLTVDGSLVDSIFARFS